MNRTLLGLMVACLLFIQPAAVGAPEIEPPHCSDRIDNDGDGLTDYPDDNGCSWAEDDSEIEEPHWDARFVRSVALTSLRHVDFPGVREILAKGWVRAEGAEECGSEVPIEIQIRKDGAWVTRKKGVTDPDGSFKILVRDTPGKYRAMAPKHVVIPDPETFGECMRGAAVRRHAHT